MPIDSLVQTRIDPRVKERAADVLGELGTSVSDPVRSLLTRSVNEGALPSSIASNPAEHDAWFRARVLEALEDKPSATPRNHMEGHERRAAVHKKERDYKGDSSGIPGPA